MLLSLSSNHFEAPRDQAKKLYKSSCTLYVPFIKVFGERALGLEICLIKMCTCECYGYYVFESYNVGTLIRKQITSNTRN